MNAKLSQHRFWPRHANGFNKVIPMILMPQPKCEIHSKKEHDLKRTYIGCEVYYGKSID